MSEQTAGWEVTGAVPCVACPECGFTFDAVHKSDGGNYVCPCCGEQEAEKRAEQAEAELQEAREALQEIVRREKDWLTPATKIAREALKPRATEGSGER